MEKLFDIKKMISINIGSCNQQQLFAFSQYYSIDFELMVELKLKFRNIWVEVIPNENAKLIAMGDRDSLKSNYGVGFTKNQIKSLNKVPNVKCPKMPKDNQTLENYNLLLKKGYEEIRTQSLDQKIEYLSQLNLIDDMVKCGETKNINKPSTLVKLDLDSILDKINELGMNSLTIEERDFLLNFSKS